MIKKNYGIITIKFKFQSYARAGRQGSSIGKESNSGKVLRRNEVELRINQIPATLFSEKDI